MGFWVVRHMDAISTECKHISVFISSPGDVLVERSKAQLVVSQLAKRYAGRLVLEPILWEQLPLTADMSFQQGIELVLNDQHGVDVAVFILWSRLGSPLGPRIRKLDGSEYRSGTEREFDLMLAAREEATRKQLDPIRPEILAYVREDEAGFKRALLEKRSDELEEAIRQYKLAEQFIREQFHETESGTNLSRLPHFP